jgi:hypothetical protein
MTDTAGFFWGGGSVRPRKRAGDRGAHHRGVCVPTSVLENRAPLLILMAPTCGGAEQRSLSYNAETTLACKRNRQDGVSESAFQTITIVKSLNTLWVALNTLWVALNTLWVGVEFRVALAYVDGSRK